MIIPQEITPCSPQRGNSSNTTQSTYQSRGGIPHSKKEAAAQQICAAASLIIGF